MTNLEKFLAESKRLRTLEPDPMCYLCKGKGYDFDEGIYYITCNCGRRNYDIFLKNTAETKDEMIRRLASALEACQVGIRGGSEMHGVFWREFLDEAIKKTLDDIEELAKKGNEGE